MSVLFYRRPDYLNKASGPVNVTECARYVERAKKSERAIPSGLSFENVIDNKTLPPCSLNDFMDYLVYVEHNAENLQFYLWYRDYVRRFEALPDSEKCLSPEWIPDNDVPKLAKDQDESQTSSKLAKRASVSTTMMGKTGFNGSLLPSAEEMNEGLFPQSFHPKASISVIRDNESFVSKVTSATNKTSTARKWEPFTVQPMREEITRLTHHYLLFSSSRELNLSHRDRATVLHALQHTTHPSALSVAFQIVESTLRGQAHPNFIRWSICNGNKPRVFFVRTMGVSNTLLGFAIAILLTLSKLSRWWRVFAALEWFLGIGTLIAAYKGLCIIMHHSHVRNLRPWEQDLANLDFEEAGGRDSDDSGADRTIRLASRVNNDEEDHDSRSTLGRNSMRSFGEKNSWDGEWLARYERKSLLRKVFDKNVWTQDETLRVLQDRIVLGANIWAAICTLILTVVFVALPKGDFY